MPRGYYKPLRRGGSAFIPRNSRGRFRKVSLEQDFGLRVAFCPNEDCRAINPYGVNEPKPDRCHRCGRALVEEA